MDLRKPFLFLPALFLLTAATAVAFWSLPRLLQKDQFLKHDRTLGLALDWGDLALHENPEAAFSRAAAAGVGYAVLDIDEKPEVETLVRGVGAHVLWREDFLTPERFTGFSSRLKAGDGVLPNEEGSFGYPGYLVLTRTLLLDKKGFVPVVEFASNKGAGLMTENDGPPAVKTHLLHLEETLRPAPDLWRARLVRAARERAVRLLIVRLSPAWSSERQMGFVESVSVDLILAGYTWGQPSGDLPPWPVRKVGGFSWFPALMFAGCGPLAGLILGLAFFPRRLWPAFFTIVAGSMVSGLAAHSMAFDVRALSGLTEFRGVKAALVFPLVFSIPLLFSPAQLSGLWDQPIRFKHAVVLGGIIFLFLGGLLIRSGNFPIFSVTDSERHLRDLMENLFVVRPRFKEFLIGTPLLLHGLRLRSLRPEGKLASPAEMFLMVVGMVGPVSMVNTFCHLHAQMGAGLLRTFHGLWLGAAVYGATILFIRLRSRRPQ